MTMTRRAMLGLAFGGIFYQYCAPVRASRFVDGSGLHKGQFIWQPALAKDGPILVVVTARQQVAHVYRGGQQIGIAALKSVAPGARRLAGAFAVADLQRERHGPDGARDPRLAWRADVIEAHAVSGRFARQPLALLSDDFAELLFQASARGATVVVAEDRGNVGSLRTDGFPLLRGASARTAAAALLERAARPIETADPMGHEAAIVVSLAEGEARLVRAGAVEASTAVTLAEGATVSGSHVYSLVGGSPESGASGLEWLTVAVARTSDAPHLGQDGAARVLSALTLPDEKAATAMAHELGRGALLYVTDDRLTPSRHLQRGFELMANRTAAPQHADEIAQARKASSSRLAHGRAARPVRTVEVPEVSAAPARPLVRELLEGSR